MVYMLGCMHVFERGRVPGQPYARPGSLDKINIAVQR